jgi:hypothetical protein
VPWLCWDMRGRGEIGRHAGFRFLWGNPWGFKSLRPHHDLRAEPAKLLKEEYRPCK